MNDSSNPLVTIITPSFNQGEFIEDTIKSVLAQDYENIEYMVFDGGSTDNTLEVLKKYNDKIQWKSKKDKGQSFAIEKGFKWADGDIIVWLNSDDTLLPDAVTRAVKEFEGLLKGPDKVAFVYGRSHYIDAAGKAVGDYPVEEFDMERLSKVNFISQPSVFINKSCYDAVGGIDTSLNYTFDYDLWIRLSRKYKVKFINEFLSNYRLHKDSKTVSPIHAIKNSGELLRTVMKHYRHAPPNRVFVYTYNLMIGKFKYLSKLKILLLPIVFFISFLSYFLLNKGIRLKDLKDFGFSNLKKAFTHKGNSQS